MLPRVVGEVGGVRRRAVRPSLTLQTDANNHAAAAQGCCWALHAAPMRRADAAAAAERGGAREKHKRVLAPLYLSHCNIFLPQQELVAEGGG